MPLLDVQKLRTYFHTRNGTVRAVDGVSYVLEAGETLGIVGESGSGKSVSQYSLLGLIPTPPGRIESGCARFGGIDLLQSSQAELRRIRGKRISMIFQDPMTALNPFMTIGGQIIEPLRVHEGCSKSEARQRAVEALGQVGIQDAATRIRMYPHEFSGGMRQRVMVAMALITHPELLIADEPSTALDVTVQAQILDLIQERQQSLGMAVVLITHDLGVIAGTCGRVLVMYAGRIVESAETRKVFYSARHPYTQALLESMPSVHAQGDTLFTIPGMPPDLTHAIEGCPFAPRCREVRDACRTTPCVLREVEPGHATACLRVQAGEL